MPAKVEKLYYTIFNSPELETVKAYLEDDSSLAHSYAGTPNDFLNLVGPDGKTNLQRIKSHYKLPEEKQKYANATYDTLPIKPGTILYLEDQKVNEMGFLTKGIKTVSYDDVAFKAE